MLRIVLVALALVFLVACGGNTQPDAVFSLALSNPTNTERTVFATLEAAGIRPWGGLFTLPVGATVEADGIPAIAGGSEARIAFAEGAVWTAAHTFPSVSGDIDCVFEFREADAVPPFTYRCGN